MDLRLIIVAFATLLLAMLIVVLIVVLIIVLVVVAILLIVGIIRMLAVAVIVLALRMTRHDGWLFVDPRPVLTSTQPLLIVRSSGTGHKKPNRS